jgi:hypothetical protein
VKVVRIAVWEEAGDAPGKTTVGETLNAVVRGGAPAAFREASSITLAALIRKRAAD